MQRSSSDRSSGPSAGTQRPRLGPRGRLLLRFGRQRRNPPIARIDDERGPPRRDDASAPLPEQVVVAGGKVGLCIAVAAIGIVALPRPFFIGSRFGLRQKLFPRELGGAFERRHGGVGPDALQIALAEPLGEVAWAAIATAAAPTSAANVMTHRAPLASVREALVTWSVTAAARRGRPRRPSRRSRESAVCS